MVSSLGALGLSRGDVVPPRRRDLARDLRETALSARDLISMAASRREHDISTRGSQAGEWLEASEQRLDHLTGLQPDWDGYGGTPVAEETRTLVLKLLYNVLSPNDAVPALVPGSDGAVNVEWRRPGLIFEVEVEPSGHLCAYYLDEERGGEEWEGDYRDIEPLVGDFIARFSQ